MNGHTVHSLDSFLFFAGAALAPFIPATLSVSNVWSWSNFWNRCEGESPPDDTRSMVLFLDLAYEPPSTTKMKAAPCGTHVRLAS